MRLTRSLCALGAAGLLASCVGPNPAQGGRTFIESVSSAENPGVGNSQLSSISSDGDYIAFDSYAPNLVADDTNEDVDVFMRNTTNGTTERVSISNTEQQANGPSRVPDVSSDGRYVSFQSAANNLVTGDSNSTFDIFVRDRSGATTKRVSVSNTGQQANGQNNFPAMSDNGRYVVFSSTATNLHPGDTNAERDIFMRDTVANTTHLISVGLDGGSGNGSLLAGGQVSNDGRYVVFESSANNLVPGDTNNAADIFRRDVVAGVTTRVSYGINELPGNGASYRPSVTPDGRWVSFASEASNLVSGDTNGYIDVFVRDMNASGNATTRVSVRGASTQGNGTSGYIQFLANEAAPISADGRYVVFASDASNLVDEDQGGKTDAFIRDLQSGTTKIISKGNSDNSANGDSYATGISDDGRSMTFDSDASNITALDINASRDVFSVRP